MRAAPNNESSGRSHLAFIISADSGNVLQKGREEGGLTLSRRHQIQRRANCCRLRGRNGKTTPFAFPPPPRKNRMFFLSLPPLSPHKGNRPSVDFLHLLRTRAQTCGKVTIVALSFAPPKIGWSGSKCVCAQVCGG